MADEDDRFYFWCAHVYVLVNCAVQKKLWLSAGQALPWVS